MLVGAASLNAQAQAPTQDELHTMDLMQKDWLLDAPLWSDFQDIVKYKPKALPDAQVMLSAIKVPTNPLAKVVGQDGAKIVGTIALQDFPKKNGENTVYGNVTAFMRGTDQKYFFRRFSATIATVNNVRQVISAVAKPEGGGDDLIPADMPLSGLSFEVSAGLVSRMVALEDPIHDIMMIYPLGVGGIDPGLVAPGGTHILTPMFQNATIQRKNVISARTEPKYYRGMPFLGIANSKGVRTSVGFHITILSDEDWAKRGGSYLVRGFDSHGCMRLRSKDLTEFFTIVMNGASDAVPVNVSYFIYNRDGVSGGDRNRAYGLLWANHPYPLNEAYFQEVTNTAPPGQPPQYGRDPKEHLVLMNEASGKPNFTHLEDFSADQENDLAAFEAMGATN